MPNAIALGPGSNVEIEDVSISPCPYCGGEGHIPDGIYNTAAEGIRVFATSPRSAQSLALLRILLEEARNRKASGAQVADAIDQRAPEFKSLASFLRKFGRSDVIALITLLVLLISWYQSNKDSAAQLDAIKAQTQATQAQTTELERIYNAIISQVQVPEKQPVDPATGAPTKLGRNDTCWCGSGKKFKRCHGSSNPTPQRADIR
jgi:SEC-C motif